MLIRRVCSSFRLLAHNYALKSQGLDPLRLPQHCPLIIKAFSSDSLSVESDVEKPPKRKKTPIIPKITLLSGQDVTVTTMEEAGKLAKRRDLKLVKILDLDTKSQRPVYQLMSGAEYLKEDLKQRERKKDEKGKGAFRGEKLLTVQHNISEHDLRTHLNKIVKWLGKRYEVRVVISGSSENMQKAEEVCTFLTSKLITHGRVVQKRQKGSDIKFQAIPPKESKDADNGSDNGGSKSESTV